MKIRLFIITLVIFSIIALSEYLTYYSFYSSNIIESKYLEFFIIVLGLIVPVVFIFTMFYGYKHYSKSNSVINMISSIWLVFVLYLFIFSLFIFILLIINSYLNSNIPLDVIAIIFIYLAFLLTIYGVWNSYNLIIKTYVIKSENLSKDWSKKKIVIISDFHIGNTRNENYIKKVISKINEQKPDIVFLLGDIIEGTSFPYEKWFNQFNKLNPQLGNYYVEGNHEKYSQEYELFKSNFPKNIIDTTDKKLIINNTQIIGLRHVDYESKVKTTERLNELNYDKEKSSILLIHDPKNTKSLTKTGVSLILSGHTHNGQFFPFTLFIKSIYKKYAYGLNKTNNTISITSSGVGTSMIPFRLGTSSEIVVLIIE